MTRRHLLQWDATSVLLVLAAWTVLVILNIANHAVLAQQYGNPFDLADSAARRSIDWYSCAVFTPLFVWLARRFPMLRGTWRRDLLIWLAATMAVTPVRFALQHAAMVITMPGAPQPPLASRITGGFIMEVVAFWLMAGIILAVEYYDRWRDRDVQAHVLATQLAEARVEALTAQLQPHFLFNTLQGISTLLYRDAAGADDMLRRLSELLRRTLQASARPEVTLDEELATLEHYIAIQRIRFQDRLTVNVDSDGMGNALVPNFILQPLVENAIEHGIARSAGAGRIDITARAQDARLCLAVRDDGTAARTPHNRESNGIGLANTRARLDALFDGAASLDVRPAGDGFEARITMPLRRAVK